MAPQNLIGKKKKNDKTIQSLEVFEVVLVQCNLVDNQYQQDPGVLYVFTPNTFYGHLLNVEPRNLVFLKTYNNMFDEIIIKFTNPSSRKLERQDKTSFKLLVNT